MLSSFILGFSAFISILWSIVFLIPRIIGYNLNQVSGNMLSEFLPNVKTCSYFSNGEPNGWVIGWEKGFYIGYIFVISNGNNSIKSFYILSSQTFYEKNFSKKNNVNDTLINNPPIISLFTREGSFWSLEYRDSDYTPPSKLFPPRLNQSKIIEDILNIYDVYLHPYVRVLLCAKPGFGKSAIAIQLCNELLKIYKEVALVTTWCPTDPNDSFVRLYNKVKPTKDKPLVILLDEIDITVKNMLSGEIKISDATPMPIEIMSKKSWNDFFDAFDREMYKYVIIIMTSNQHTSYFNQLDSSLLREGRIDISTDCI